jgi:hypothetical protein
VLHARGDSKSPIRWTSLPLSVPVDSIGDATDALLDLTAPKELTVLSHPAGLGQVSQNHVADVEPQRVGGDRDGLLDGECGLGRAETAERASPDRFRVDD